jgi:hypothetical protein
MKNIKLSAILAFVAFIMFAPTLKAQQDLGSIVGLDINKKIKKLYTLTFAGDWQTRNMLRSPEQVTNQLGLGRKMNENFDAGIDGYIIHFHRNYYGCHRDESFGWENRYVWDAYVKGHIQYNNWTLSLKETYEQTYCKDVEGKDKVRNGINPERMLRSVVEADYKLSKWWTPYAYAEVYNPLNKPSNNDIQTVRVEAGATYKWTKNMHIKLFCRYDDFIDSKYYDPVLGTTHDIDNGKYKGRINLGTELTINF